MDTLNKVVEKYLEENGIMIRYFSDFIGCNLSTCSRWLKGERKLNPEQIRKTHDFLQGKHIKTVEDIMKE